MELQIDNIKKHYKDKKAVDGISLSLTPGVWGLLGANGAGKTTLMRMIAGIMPPTSGEIRYDGIPITVLKEQYKDVFGYLPQDFGFYPEYSVKDYLEYMACLKGLPAKKAKQKIDELLQKVSLEDVYKKKISKLSGGMKRRVGIAQALLNDPKILVLDEPTSGLDPAERIKFRNILSEFAHDRIVLISTHIVSDVEYIAGKNAIMKNGKLEALGTTEELISMAQGKVWECRVGANEVHKLQETMLIVNLKNESDDTISIRYLSDEAMTKDSVSVPPRLEDLYLWLFPQEKK